MAYESAIDKPAGTLSSTSAATGRVYSTPSSREKATKIRRETGEEPSPEEVEQIQEKSPSQTSPTAAVEPRRVTAADILTGRTEGRQFVGVVKGKVIYGTTFGEKEKEFQPTAIKYARTPTQRIKEQRARAKKQARQRQGLKSAYTTALQQKQPKKITSEVREYKPRKESFLTGKLKEYGFPTLARIQGTAVYNVERTSHWFTKFQSKMAYKSQYAKSQLARTGAGITSVGAGYIKPTFIWPAELIVKPIESAKGIYYTGKTIITDPYKIGYKIRQKIQQDPGGATGTFLGLKYGIIKPLKEAYVKIGSKYTAPQKIFEPKVLAGKETFPKPKGITPTQKVQYTMKEFKEANYKVVHATGKKFAKKTQISKGTSTDVGLYTTPYGKGSPHFLRAGMPAGSRKLISFPKVELFPSLRIPEAVVINLKSVKRFPKAYRYASRSERAKFLRSQAGKKTAYITYELERGKPEIEAVIPPGTKIVYSGKGGLISKAKGFEGYTQVGSEPIAIGTYKIVSKSSPGKAISPKALIRRSSEINRPSIKPYRSYGIIGSAGSRYAAPQEIIRGGQASPYTISSKQKFAWQMGGINFIPTSPPYSKLEGGRSSKKYPIIKRSSKAAPSPTSIIKSYPPSTIKSITSRTKSYSPSAAKSITSKRVSYPARSYPSRIAPTPFKNITPIYPRPRDKNFIPEGRKRISLEVRQPKRLTPTGRAAGFEVVGKTPKAAEFTGLGGRPIKKVKKKLKEVFKI
ncbi:hypothetical protein GF386_05335 [Candidatus Pacearchaeota archaeon]|nr:hypothetical protein [Candidatus Pacearchaeota archaeon]